jgi:uncharacterized repeat protein (TIGR01451 family)
MSTGRFCWVMLSVVAAGPALAQPPDDPPRVDPDVAPAQFVQPVAPGGIPPAAAPTGTVTDPPTPVVRVQVRVPANVAPGKDLEYKIVVANTSQADAYRVTVRNPLPAGTTFVRAEPQPDTQQPAQPAALVWTIGTLRAGERREIELVLKPADSTKEIRNQAFVHFEHGQAVVTKIDKPKLAVSKVAPKQAVQTDPIPVRVVVENKGRVPVAGVRLVENVTKGFEFAPGTDGEKGNSPEQRVWELGTLRPGERKVVEYRLTAKETAELFAQSAVNSPDVPEAERAESTTKVLTADLALELTGPSAVSAGEPATFEIVARNTGTLTLTDVRVSGSIPSDCTLTRMTDGGQRYRDQVVWAVPQLKPGEAQSFRLGLRANTTGQRTVRAAAWNGRGLEKARELRTSFQGTALVQWRAELDPQVTLGQQRQLTVRVENHGGEPARDVRLRVVLPSQVTPVQASPRHQPSANEIAFDAVTIPANGEETFTVTYRADRTGQAYFTLKLSADTLGEQPLIKEQAVEITGGR